MSRAASPRASAGGSATAAAPTSVTISPRIAVRARCADAATTAPMTTASATPARAGFTVRRSWRGGRQLRVGGRVQDPEDVDRPVAQPGATDHRGDRHRPERSRIGRVRSMVAHQEQLALGNDPLVLVAGHRGRLGIGLGLGIDVWLRDLGAIDEDVAVADVDRVATETDDPLDE